MIKLVSTLHDPKGLFVQHIARQINYIKNLFCAIEIVATPNTSNKTIDMLRKNSINVDLTGSDKIGESRRICLKNGVADFNTKHFHYCDFDRLLHWAINYPSELTNFVDTEIEKHDYTIIGRTQRAFNTHPEIQIETELITNKFFSFVNGKYMDVTAGSCGLSRQATNTILSLSIEPSNATDSEWPMIIKSQSHLSLGYFEAEGLEFETPTFYGKNAYLFSETLENYKNRIMLTKASIDSIIRIHNQNQ